MDEKNREIEWQFDVKNLEHLREYLSKFFAGLPYTVKNKKAALQTDSYFDTDDFMFYNAGFSLRIRHRDSFIASLKSIHDLQNGEDKEGPRSRIEISDKVGGDSITNLLAKKKGELRTLMRSKHPKAKLLKLFVLEVEREQLMVFLDKQLLLEIALDRGRQVNDPNIKKPLSIRRLEIEVKNQSLLPEATRLVTKLTKYLRKHDPSLRRAQQSKFVMGMRHNSLRAIGPHFSPPVFKKDLPVECYVVEIFKKYLTKALAKEAGCRLGFDRESVHLMRVSLRKILSAMKVYVDYIPVDLLAFKPFMKDLISALGKVRDLDVQMAALRESKILRDYANGEGVLEIIDFLNKKRNEAQKQLLRTMNGKNYGLMVNDLQVLLNSDDTAQKNSPPVDILYKSLLKKHIDSFVKEGKKLSRNSKPKLFHKLRIAGKKLRYAIEFLKPLDEKKIGKMADLMAFMQDSLGLINDCRVGKEKLIGLADNKNAQFSPLALYKMGQASMHYVVTEKEERAKFIDKWGEIDWLRYRKNF